MLAGLVPARGFDSLDRQITVVGTICGHRLLILLRCLVLGMSMLAARDMRLETVTLSPSAIQILLPMFLLLLPWQPLSVLLLMTRERMPRVPKMYRPAAATTTMTVKQRSLDPAPIQQNTVFYTDRWHRLQLLSSFQLSMVLMLRTMKTMHIGTRMKTTTASSTRQKDVDLAWISLPSANLPQPSFSSSSKDEVFQTNSLFFDAQYRRLFVVEMLTSLTDSLPGQSSVQLSYIYTLRRRHVQSSGRWHIYSGPVKTWPRTDDDIIIYTGSNKTWHRTDVVVMAYLLRPIDDTTYDIRSLDGISTQAWSTGKLSQSISNQAHWSPDLGKT